MAEKSFWGSFTEGAGSLLDTWGAYENRKSSIDYTNLKLETERAKAAALLAAAKRPVSGVTGYQGPSAPTSDRAGSETYGPQTSKGSGMGMGAIILVGALFLLSKVL